MTDDHEFSRGRVWDAASLIAMGAGLLYGARNIPPAIEGIPFVQVLPAMALGGLGVLLVDILGVIVAPRANEQEMVWLHLCGLVVILGIVIMRPVARATRRIREVFR